MTYLLALNFGKRTTIIADTAITYRDSSDVLISRDEAGGIKTGFLFPDGGAIYGLCGNYQAASDFIQNFKRELANSRLSGANPEAISNAWDLLTRFVARYRFPKQHFTIVISTRHLGNPLLYVLDSQSQALERVDAGGIALGSGASLMNPVLTQFHEEHIASVGEILKYPEGVDNSYWLPYVYCLKFMEYVCGVERKLLINAGVGGFFHNTQQTTTREYRQLPAVYLMTTQYGPAEMSVILPYLVRFLPLSHALEGVPKGDILVVSKASAITGPAEQMAQKNSLRDRVIADALGPALPMRIHFDSAAWPHIDMFTDDELLDQAQAALDDPEYHGFNFCGVGYTNPAHRGALGIAYGNMDNIRPLFDATLPIEQQISREMTEAILGAPSRDDHKQVSPISRFVPDRRGP